MSKKSILEQALLQVETLEEVMKANAKGILASTMKKEIKNMLKEDEDEDDEKEVEEPESQETDEPSDEIDGDDKATDMPTDMPTDDMGGDMGDTSDEPTDMPTDDMDGDDETLDLTNSSDEEVIKVYKSLKPEDGVIVKKSGDDIKMKTGDDDYLIRLNDEDDETMSDFNPNDEIDEDMDYDSPDGIETPNFEDESDEDEDEFDFEEDDEYSETDDDNDEEEMYEIELGDDEESDNESKEVEVDESARTKGFGYHGGLEAKKIFKAGNKREEINEEISKLKKQNSEYRKALILFKDKLNEVAVFNANLAYSSRLFTEHTTTKQEKINILKRFDGIENLNESKKLYNTIKTELTSKKPVVESVVNKITSTPTTSSSKEILTESKAYENPAFKRIKELMNKMS